MKRVRRSLFSGIKWETENVPTIEQLITEIMQENKTVNVLYERLRPFFLF